MLDVISSYIGLLQRTRTFRGIPAPQNDAMIFKNGRESLYTTGIVEDEMLK